VDVILDAAFPFIQTKIRIHKIIKVQALKGWDIGSPMFGNYNIPLNIEQGDISLSVEKEGEGFLYKRECLGKKTKKALLTSNGEILLNPVEPLNVPKALTAYLLIAFEKALLIEPKATKKIFITFPVEIGVYINSAADSQLIDVFALTKQKFTLYGDPRNGIICRYWKSEVNTTPPSTNHLQEGIIELILSNTTSEWVEVSKAMFNGYGMKIWYNDNLVAMRAAMKLKAGGIAETDFEETPPENGMSNALEIYTTKKLSIASTKCVMEYGL